ncbi:hypothetical protein D3C71_1865250 [compost metagenome]
MTGNGLATISPNIAQCTVLLYFSNNHFISLAVRITPTIIPIPNGIRAIPLLKIADISNAIIAFINDDAISIIDS